MLVDAGGLAGSASFDIGDRVVAPVLRGAGIRRLDYLVLTHGDPDHVGGAAAVIGEFRPREVWEGIPVPPFAPLELLRRQAQATGARWANVYRGSRLTVDGVEVRALHPAPADWERRKVRNDDSIVLDVRWRGVSVLFTGDIGRAVERELAKELEPSSIRVLKVPHHGSLTSSSAEFLHAIEPAAAIVSAGRANHFGHPAPAVLQRYRDAGVQLFRTDQDGAVALETDGNVVEIRTFTGRHFVLPSAAASQTTKTRRSRRNDCSQDLVTPADRARKPGPRHDRLLHRRPPGAWTGTVGAGLCSRPLRWSSEIAISGIRTEKAIPIRYRDVVICHQRIDLIDR